MIVLRWFIEVLLAAVAVAFALKMLGKDMAWAWQHFALLCVCTFGVALATEVGGNKPEPPPTIRGLTLSKPTSNAHGVGLEWSRDDGETSGGKTYAIERRLLGSPVWTEVQVVTGETNAWVQGFLIDNTHEWRIREVGNE